MKGNNFFVWYIVCFGILIFSCKKEEEISQVKNSLDKKEEKYEKKSSQSLSALTIDINNPEEAELNFANKNSKKINIRYRKIGDDNWTEKKDVSTVYKVSGLTPKTNYEVQFTYDDNVWSLSGQETHYFNTWTYKIQSNSKIKKLKTDNNKVYFSNSLTQKKVNFRYKIYNQLGGKKWSDWKYVNDIKSGYDFKPSFANLTEYQFSYQGEKWSWDYYNAYRVRNTSILSNNNIINVNIQVNNPEEVQLGFSNNHPPSSPFNTVDIRYKAVGSDKTFSKTNVSSGDKITGLTPNTNYKIYFIYRYHFAGYIADYNIYNFNTYTYKRESNSNIYDVEIKNSASSDIEVSFKNNLPSKKVDMRYRKSGNTQWTNKEDISSGVKVSGIVKGAKYQFQFSYKGEKWSWGDYTTYSFRSLLSNINIVDRSIKVISPNQVEVSFTNKLDKQVDIRYRKDYSNDEWTNMRNVKSGFKIGGLDNNANYLMQFSYQGEWWSWGGYANTQFRTYFVPSSNINIINRSVKIINPNQVEVSFTNNLNKQVDIRYKKVNTPEWANIYDVKSGFKIGKLTDNTRYVMQFSYKGEWWSWNRYIDTQFATSRVSNDSIVDVNLDVYDLAKVKVTFNNKIPSKKVDIRYRKKASKSWTTMGDVKSGFTITGLDYDLYYIQFSYRGESWSWGGYDQYMVWTNIILSNENIVDVNIMQNGKVATILFRNKLSANLIDMRYRKRGTNSWINKRNFKNGDMITGLESGKDYEIQFSYQEESWSWAAYNTHSFRADKSYRSSNQNIVDVKLTITADFDVKVEFTNKLDNQVDIRYRKSGNTQWTNKEDISSGVKVSGIVKGAKCEIQFSYRGEWWSWGGYKTYTIDIDRESNLNITYIDEIEPFNEIVVKFNNKLSSKKVDMRYRPEGTATWIELYDVKQDQEIRNLRPKTKYEIQFSYKGEWWSWGGYNTYKRTTGGLLSGFYIRNVSVNSINVFARAKVSFSNLIPANKVDIRYKIQADSHWIYKNDFKSGGIIRITPGHTYEIQVKYSLENWSWEGFRSKIFAFWNN